MSERSAWATLALTPGVGPAAFLRLIERFGSASAALGAGRTAWSTLVPRETADALAAEAGAAAAEAALAWSEQEGCFLLTLLDDDYPERLAQSPSPPPLLFGRGRRELLARDMLAVVGSRKASAQGAQSAHAFARALSAQGYTVVSGLAAGIDAAAHQGALEALGASIAVVGTGIDRVYPASNRALAHRLASEGLILSEFALGSGPLAAHFPQRNRIIAGLCRGCLVVEAGTESGSLITARLALEAGREVMAVPGSILSPLSRGCHRLIREGARLVESADDIFDEVGRPALPPAADAPVATAAEEDGDDAACTAILDAMGFDPVDLDTLLGRVGLTAAAIYPMLLALEMQGRVAVLGGNRYQRLS
ncbi:DNA-processing protein DprA [Crenobacter caeni]|uniref:DNA-protecting protein DprA n=1 Tax=Crenobacter caeni TaxID=2705474 RepID=A0A6B2KMT9_9NEIS|nr:DNA-processing protein DprA [Crenobacter caeni]NDV11453.1 DNA-protecting protein DprA [Crenobacter caeni]